MGYIIGIDVGGSTTKIVGLKDGVLQNTINVKASDPVTSAYGAFGKFLTESGLEIADIDKVMFTGVGSSFLKNEIFGLPCEKVDEFMAIGLGGRHLTGIENALMVSMGTGTAYVSVVGDKIVHEGGTGVGGGTLLGLSSVMIGVRTFENIMALAEKGNLSNVDLTIGDISETNISNMNGEITASNFGKISDVATDDDKALGIVNLVFQTIGMCAVFAARAKGLKDVVLTGNLSKNPMARRTLTMLEGLYEIKFHIPEHSDFATAIGAAINGQNK